MMILDDIVAHKKRELAHQSIGRFYEMLKKPDVSMVCELKLKSPTHPAPFTTDPAEVLTQYKAANVDAISVVTDQKFFGGSVDLVLQARATGLPVLRKDFILEACQITGVNTDALLLIARILAPAKLKQLVALCLELGIEPVVEIHDEAELGAALASETRVLAVNSRDLQTQKIDLEDGFKLLDKIPGDRLKMFFSGISRPVDVARVKAHRVNGVLIGTSILTSGDSVHKIQELKEAL